MAFAIKVNGNTHSVDVDGDTPLLWVLRDVLGMTGTKFGCGMALCGACTVHLDGAPTRSCITSIDSIGTSEITTIEAIGATAGRRQDPEGLARPRGPSMRLLPVGPDHVRFGAAREQPASDAMPTSTTRCPATSAAAGPMSAFAKRSSRPRNRLDREADNDPRSYRFPTDRLGQSAIDERSLPAQVSAGRSGRRRRPDAEPEPAVRQRRRRSGRRRWPSCRTPSSASKATGRLS